MRDNILGGMITIGAGLFVGALYFSVAVLQPGGLAKRFSDAHHLPAWPHASVLPSM